MKPEFTDYLFLVAFILAYVGMGCTATHEPAV